MKPTKLATSAATLLGTLFFVSAGSVSAGHTAWQLEKAGYFCFNDGPTNWTHCLKAFHFGNPSVPVMVFSEDGSEFLGTELLIREDLYNDQSCPQDELEVWDFLGDPPYYACHRFHTGHH